MTDDAKRKRWGSGILVAGVGLILLYLNGAGARPPLSFVSNRASIAVERSFTENATVFASLSAIKATLGIVEGSTVGASFGASASVEVGDLVEPAHDTLDFVWHLFVYVLLLLSFYRLLLGSGILALGIPCAGLGLILGGVGILRRSEGLQGAGRLVAGWGVMVFLLLPLALVVSSQVEQGYLRPLRGDVHAHLNKLHTDLEAATGEITSGRVRGAAEAAVRVMTDATSFLFGYLAVLLLELLVMPVTVFFAVRVALGEVGRRMPPPWRTAPRGRPRG